MLQHAPHFSLEQYHLAQALDYFFLMDDDTPALIVTGEYESPSPEHTLLTEGNKDDIR